MANDKKNTPLQELKDKFMEAGCLADWMDDAFDEALAKEREDIESSYKAGQDEMIKMVEVYNEKSWFTEITFDDPTRPSDYFTQTYNTNEENNNT